MSNPTPMAPVQLSYPGESPVIIGRPALRRLLRKLRIRQDDIVAAAGVSRGAISDQLNERTATVSAPVADAIGKLIGGRGAWRDLETAAAATPPPAIPATGNRPAPASGAPARPSHAIPASPAPTPTPTPAAAAPASAPDPTPATVADAMARASASDGKVAFPLRQIHAVMTAARQMVADGTVEAVLGLRKLLTIESAWRAYMACGVAADAALDAAWCVSVSGKETGANRAQLSEVYRAAFGRAPILPRQIPNIPAGGCHPDVAAAWPLLSAGMHVWLGGEAGGGKSYGLRQLAAHLPRLDPKTGAPIPGTKRPVWVIPANKRIEPDDILGAPDMPEPGRMVFRYGMGALALKYGGVLIMEEPDRAEPEALTVMHQMLEEREIFIPATGERIIAAPGFVVGCGANSLGGGEGRYATQYMDPAFMDRFAVIEVGHMPPAMEMRIIAKRVQDAGFDIR